MRDNDTPTPTGEVHPAAAIFPMPPDDELADLAADRTCLVCKRTLPLDRFYASGHGNGRRRTCSACLSRREAAKRHARNAPTRHPRYDGHGNVWCNACKRYLPAESFKRHPQRPRTYWSYCRPCVREIDRMRWRGERRERNNRNRLKQHRRQRQAELGERREFVAGAIQLLRRRGFTKADICRLAGVSFTSVLHWERKTRPVVTPAVAARFAVLLRETADLPLQEAPEYRRRLPHPELARLLATTRDEIASHRVRSRWGERKAA